MEDQDWKKSKAREAISYRAPEANLKYVVMSLIYHYAPQCSPKNKQGFMTTTYGIDKYYVWSHQPRHAQNIIILE